jgi:hypothetical protein
MSYTNGSWIGSPTDTPLGPIGFSGGQRDLFIYYSLWNCINDSLAALGWYDSTIYDTPPGTRVHHDVSLLKEQDVNWNEELVPNTIAFAPETYSDQTWELGSDFRENRWPFYCLILAESTDISMWLAGDIRDILRGKMSTIQRVGGPIVNIYNWSAATPYRVGYLEIEHATMLRPPTYSQKWQRYMCEVRWEALDYYDSDLDTSTWAFTP